MPYFNKEIHVLAVIWVHCSLPRKMGSPKNVTIASFERPVSKSWLRPCAPVLFTYLLSPHMVCNRSWHLPGNHKLAWRPARLIKEGECMDLSLDALHLKDPLVLFGSEDFVLTVPLFLLSPRILMLCHLTFVYQCAFKHSFIHSVLSPFRPECYHLLDHNCNTFSNEVAQFLTGKPIPSYVTNLPGEVLQT